MTFLWKFRVVDLMNDTPEGSEQTSEFVYLDFEKRSTRWIAPGVMSLDNGGNGHL